VFRFYEVPHGKEESEKGRQEEGFQEEALEEVVAEVESQDARK
jgi:hypothetical protein